MPLRILISLSLALFAWQTAIAQLAPAEDFFNRGAQFYISNNIPEALDQVETGLKTYPTDEKLKKLEELLKQQQKQNQQQQQQQNQQQKQNQQSKENQQKNQQNQQNQQSQSQQQKEQQEKQNEQNKSGQQKQPEQQQQKQQSTDQQKADQEKQQKEQGQPLKPGQMTPEEAKKLLDAQKQNEQLLKMKPEGKPQDNARPIKDW